MKSLRRYIFLLGLIGFFVACNIKRQVPDNRYLLVSNKVHLPKGTEASKSEIENVIRQRPNHRTLGFRLKLRAYNTIDSSKVARDKQRRLFKYKKKNKKRLLKQEQINEKRIKKALRKGETDYKPKKIELKDTLTPKLVFRERIKYEFGEAPVIYDSLLTENSRKQIELFMQKKGYFHAKVSTEVKLKPRKKEARVHYYIVPEEACYVDTMYLRTKNNTVREVYDKYLKNGKNVLTPPFRFDSENLGKMRKSLTEYMKNRGIYGFKESYINYEVDTLAQNKKIQIAVDISQRIVGKGENEHVKPFDYTKVNHVYFHLLDTVSYEGNFKKKELDSRGIVLKSYDQLPTFDTLRYNWYKGGSEKNRYATFLYNGKLTTRAELIEFQNYLEETNNYSGDFLPQSYNRLMGLNVFKTVKPEITENEDNTIDVHYYLTPHEQQTMSFEPKATHNNSFLGVSSSLNYINRNLFRKGYKFKISLSAGFESQPEVFGSNDETTVLNDGTRSFNTLEFGPSFELEMPGLFPISLTRLSKRQNPKTIISTAYNLQKRRDFERQTIQINYLWKFYDIYRTQIFTVGIPIVGGIQFVRIDKSEEFKKSLEEQNDLFLINAYSNQAIYKDVALTYSYTNPNFKNGKFIFSYASSIDMAGMTMSLLTENKSANSDGFKEIFGQRYSQFIRLDNQLILSQYINQKNSLHYRLQLGAGIPLENNGLNLPFDYSFFGGGSNDNRGYSARTLGPGAYKYYLDSSRTSTQMGDMRLGASFEYRFKISKRFEGALFSDAGNLWTYNDDPNRVGGAISKDFYKQLSLSGGVGLRLNLTFLIIRLDAGIPLRNPALPDNAKWIFQSREPYYQEGIDKWGTDPSTGDYYYKSRFSNPFKPQFHIAIGYPF